MKKLLTCILAAVMCFSYAACFSGGNVSESGDSSSSSSAVTPPDEEVTYSTYESFWMRNHNYETMPIAVFNGLPPKGTSYTHDYLSDPQTIADYAAAGVNTVYGLYELCTTKAVEAALNTCYDYNIAYVVNMGGADNLTASSSALHNLDRVKYYDAFAGVMVSDEPGRTMFDKIRASVDVLEDYTAEAATGLLFHTNLFPTYASERQLYYRVGGGELPEGGYSYEQYLSDYMEIIKPKSLSYDFYPCRGKAGALSGGYFENMAIIRKYAMQYNVPFWTYIQACSFGGSTRVPTEGDILWQVNTALCYGAKGIQYFCGVTPANGGGETFVGSLFDRDGNKTQVYDYAKRANLQIAAIDNVLMCSKSKGVIVSGVTPWGDDSGIPDEDLLNSYGSLTSVSSSHTLTGCFDFNSKNAFYVVNDSTVETDEPIFTFNSSVKGYYVKDGVKTSFENSSLSFNLDAGEGVLIVIE